MGFCEKYYVFLLKVSFSLSVGNAFYLFIYVDFNFF